MAQGELDLTVINPALVWVKIVELKPPPFKVEAKASAVRVVDQPEAVAFVEPTAQPLVARRLYLMALYLTLCEACGQAAILNPT